jgi:probable rRNA maturation factor
MPVSLQVQVRSVRFDRKQVLRLAQAMLKIIDEPSADMSVSFVGDGRMRRLNHRFRHTDRNTDVLAFAFREANAPPVGAHLGDVVIALPTAQRQAKAAGRPLEEELVALLIHGVLHLCGYDHERSRAEALRMQRKERQMRRRLGRIDRFVRAQHKTPLPTRREV